VVINISSKSHFISLKLHYDVRSSCGYDPQSRQDRESKKVNTSPTKKWNRRVPYIFTGCLAHVEVTERVSDGEITRIVGHLSHNDTCASAMLQRLPAIPLHENVYEVALNQLEDGARYAQIILF